MAQLLQLRWLDAHAHRPGPDNGDPAPAAGRVRHPGVASTADRHDLVNAVTAIDVAAGLLDSRWDDLTDDQRRELTATIRARAQQVRGLLSEPQG